jgi:hypothetical protein
MALWPDRAGKEQRFRAGGHAATRCAGNVVAPSCLQHQDQAHRSRGFRESEHYLHLYADHYVDAGEPAQAVQPRPGLEPIKVFLHATLDHEAGARKKFRRVHVCRRFAQPIDG